MGEIHPGGCTSFGCEEFLGSKSTFCQGCIVYVNSHFEGKGLQVHSKFIRPTRDGMKQHCAGSFNDGA